MIDNEDDLRVLVEAANQGNRESFGILYEEYFSPIYRFVYFQIKHQEEAEDITQLVFLKALKNIERYELRDVPFRAWLYQIARNTVKDFWKKKKDVIFQDPETAFANLTDGAELLDEKHREEEKAFLIEKVQELSDSHRDIIILHCIEGMSYSEISEITGKKEEALRALKYRALKILKENFKKDERS